MNWLVRLYGWPHELLHVLALLLIGRRPRLVAQTYVDIPDNLTTGQYVFVAGFPALVFGLGTLICVVALLDAPDVGQFLLRFVLMSLFSVATFGTMGDLYLIAQRLSAPPTHHNQGE